MRKKKVYSKSAQEYLSIKSDIQPDGCHYYSGSRKKVGGSYCSLGNVRWAQIYNVTMAHQLAYVLTYGQYDKSLHICHTCDVPYCINPKHLWAGTAAENNKDKSLKGRWSGGNRDGSLNPHSKLTDKDVVEIRVDLLDIPAKELAAKYGVCPKTIRNVRNRKTYVTCEVGNYGGIYDT